MFINNRFVAAILAAGIFFGCTTKSVPAPKNSVSPEIAAVAVDAGIDSAKEIPDSSVSGNNWSYVLPNNWTTQSDGSSLSPDKTLSISFSIIPAKYPNVRKCVTNQFIVPIVTSGGSILENRIKTIHDQDVVAIESEMSEKTSLDFFALKDNSLYHLSCNLLSPLVSEVDMDDCFQVVETLEIK